MIARRGWTRVQSLRQEDIVGESAKVAFFLLLSIFPLVLSLLSLAAYIGGDPAVRSIVTTLQLALPLDTAAVVEGFLVELAAEDRPGLFSAGLGFSLWAASIAFYRLGEAMRGIHDLNTSRSWIRRRLRAFGVSVLASLAFMLGLVVILADPAVPGAPLVGQIWGILRWPLPLFLLGFVLGITYFFLPARGDRASKSASFLGGVFAALLWLLATAGLRFYVRNVGEFGPAYGPVSALIVVMGWVYVTAMIVLVGSKLVALREARREARRTRTSTEAEGPAGPQDGAHATS